jgi:hypothetical protein
LETIDIKIIQEIQEEQQPDPHHTEPPAERNDPAQRNGKTQTGAPHNFFRRRRMHVS